MVVGSLKTVRAARSFGRSTGSPLVLHDGCATRYGFPLVGKRLCARNDALRAPIGNSGLRVGMVIFVFDTHHANNILTDSPEHGDHHGTLGMHRACIKHELPTSEGMTFFPY